MTAVNEPKDPRGRRHKITDKDRGFVKGATMYGAQQSAIAEFLGMSINTLKKHFKEELKAKEWAKIAVIKTAFDIAVNDRNPSMVMFLCKTMCGMSEKTVQEIQTTGTPFEIRFKTPEINAKP